MCHTDEAADDDDILWVLNDITITVCILMCEFWTSFCLGTAAKGIFHHRNKYAVVVPYRQTGNKISLAVAVYQ